MAVDPDNVAHVLDLFSGLGPIRTGRMFSGVSLFVEDDVMFGMISSSQVVYLKSDDATRPALENAGSVPFWYRRGSGEQQVTSLMSLPESAMDDPGEALDWARQALPPARVAADKKRRDKARKAARAIAKSAAQDS